MLASNSLWLDWSCNVSEGIDETKDIVWERELMLWLDQGVIADRKNGRSLE